VISPVQVTSFGVVIHSESCLHIDKRFGTLPVYPTSSNTIHIAFLTATLLCDNYGLASPPANFEISLVNVISALPLKARACCVLGNE